MIPEEIDTHFQMYGKHAWEVEVRSKGVQYVTKG